METIRRSVFETNSSSSHSIVINDSATDFTSMIPDKDGNIVFTGGEFGWEQENYNDPWTKANYCAIDQQDNHANINMLKEVIKEQTGAKKVLFDFDTDYNEKKESYIDHQSAGTSDEAFASKETLKKFIFGKGSVLYTDNDNH